MMLRSAPWRNWARTESVRPVRVERPTSVAAVQRAVVAAGQAGLTVKAVGAGRSSTGIAVAPGVQLDLVDLRLPGLDSGCDVDTTTAQVTVAAGMTLHRLNRLLERRGLALTNVGDTDRQTVAGAISTGTHGTGGRFTGMSSQVVGLSLVVGDGSVLRVSEAENAALLPAVRLGLGALGIIVSVTLQCVPRFLLHVVEKTELVDVVLEEFLQRTESADHFEFSWFPHTGSVLTTTNTRLSVAEPGARRARMSRWIDDELTANGVYRAACDLGTSIPALVPPTARLTARLAGGREFTDDSRRVFSSSPSLRFREMEYAVPREQVADAVRAVRSLIERRQWRISFPVAVRSASADDLWLSSAYGRDTGYISVHRYIREDPTEYFHAVEDILRSYDARPHWGKLHFQDADSLRPLFDHFDDFRAVRDRLDPERRFTNSYLERVLGP